MGYGGIPDLNTGFDLTRGMMVGQNIASSKEQARRSALTRKLMDRRWQREDEAFDIEKAGVKAQRMVSVLNATTEAESKILNAAYFPGTQINWAGPDREMVGADGKILSGPLKSLLNMQQRTIDGVDPQENMQQATAEGVVLSTPRIRPLVSNAKTFEGALVENLPASERTPSKILKYANMLTEKTTRAPKTFEGVLAKDGRENILGNVADLVTAKTSAKVLAQKTSEAKFNLPKIEESARQNLAVIDKAIAHPGRETVTGMSGLLDPRTKIRGTEAMDFKVILDQINGKAFLEAFQSLRGGGQITEAEGDKATAAIARLNTAQSDEAFLEALQELRGIIEAGVERARKEARGTVDDGYRFLGGDPGDENSWEKVAQ